jgi:hypothetical protein
MDRHWFDDLSRNLAKTRNRRAFVRVVIAFLALAADAQTRNAVGQEACPESCPDGQSCLGGVCQRVCETHRDCRSKHDDPCISNMCVNGVCNEDIIDCLPGFECCKGECCAKGCADDSECHIFDPCRYGTCGAEGLCEFTTLDPCVICETDEDCAANEPNVVCCAGSCKRPCPEGTQMGKGCECRADESAALSGLVVRDDASGGFANREPEP